MSLYEEKIPADIILDSLGMTSAFPILPSAAGSDAHEIL